MSQVIVEGQAFNMLNPGFERFFLGFPDVDPDGDDVWFESFDEETLAVTRGVLYGFDLTGTGTAVTGGFVDGFEWAESRAFPHPEAGLVFKIDVLSSVLMDAVTLATRLSTGNIAGVWDLVLSRNDRIAGDDLIAFDDRLIGLGGNDTLSGHGGDDRLDGGAGRDTLLGGAGEDLLTGGAGADRLDGGTARDILRGGGGADSFVLAVAGNAARADRIADFDGGAGDRLLISRAVFAGLGGANGVIDPRLFAEGTAAQDSDDRLIWDADTGRLFHDRDGTGDAGPVLIARLGPGVPLSADDIFLIA